VGFGESSSSFGASHTPACTATIQLFPNALSFSLRFLLKIIASLSSMCLGFSLCLKYSSEHIKARRLAEALCIQHIKVAGL
jgi:hypothetical protein